MPEPTRSLPPTAEPAELGNTRDFNHPTVVPDQSGSVPAVVIAPDASGRYVIGEEIARGGMGVIHRATDTILGREVAIKVLRDQFGRRSGAARRFADEARISAQLQHPAVPPVHDLGTLEDGRPFLAMKLIKGESLDVLLSNRADPTSDRGHFVAVFEHICHAVAYAHAHRVIHRDLKPANVMVGNYGEVQVMDWGLAKVLGSHATVELDPGATATATAVNSLRDPDDTFTQAGSVLGTPAFMPPEQALGAITKIDARSDVFGLGAILAVILTGKPPFASRSAETTRIQAAQGKVDECFARLDGCGSDPGLVELCKRCLSPSPADRPTDAGEVARAVAELRQAADERARKAELDRLKAEGAAAAAILQAGELRRRRKVQLALAAAVGLLTFGGVGVAWWADRQATTRRAERELGVERARHAVESAIALASDLRDKFRFDEASSALGNVTEQIPDDAPSDIRHRLDRARADLALVSELDQLRVGRLQVNAARAASTQSEAFRAAFLAHGVDPSGPDVDAVEWVLGSAVKKYLLEAIDDWAMVERDAVRQERLLRLARRGDPGPWSERVRHPEIWRDPARLPQLAKEADVHALSSHQLALLFRLQQVNWPGGSATVAAAASLHRGDFWVQMEAGYHFLRKDPKPALAVGYLRAALAIRPNQTYPLTQLAACLTSAKDFEGAIVCYKEVVRIEPSSALAQENLAIALRDGGDPEGAAIAFREAIRLDPLFAHDSLDRAQFANTDWDGVVLSCRRALDLAPDSSIAHDNLGRALFAKADWVGAIRSFRRELELAPDSGIAHHNLGRALLASGEVDGAIACYREALRHRPTFEKTYHFLEVALARKGDRELALAAYREAVRLDPESPRAHLGLGQALHDNGDPHGAVVEFRETTRLAPKFAQARNSLGLSLEHLGDVNSAADSYREAVRLASNEPNYAGNLARADLLRELFARVPDIVAGKPSSTTPAEMGELARLCARPFQNRFLDAYRLHKRALAANAAFTDEETSSHRYNAACYAVRAARGEGINAPADRISRATLRAEALGWLRSDLDFRKQQATSLDAAERKLSAFHLANWIKDSDLAGIRNPFLLAALPAEEVKLWLAVWLEVRAARDEALKPRPPPPRPK